MRSRRGQGRTTAGAGARAEAGGATIVGAPAAVLSLTIVSTSSTPPVNDYAFFTEVIEENMDMSKKTKQLII